MAIIRRSLSASTNGQPVGLTTIPTTVHASTTAASTSDEVHVWFCHAGTSTATVFMILGTTNGTQFPIEVPAGGGLFLGAPGVHLASGNTLYALTSNVTQIFAVGFVNRLTTGA